jgi:hypothetical protein
VATKTPEQDGGGASTTTEPAAGSSTGTDVSLRDYFFALRQADERLRQADHMFAAERDLRYREVGAMNDRRLAEVAVEREKALKIKEEADKAALGLAREIQTYKDEKANELREQINSERGLYASKGDLIAATAKLEAIVKPLGDYVTSQQGRSQGISLTAGIVLTVVGLIFTLIFVGLAVAGFIATH